MLEIGFNRGHDISAMLFVASLIFAAIVVAHVVSLAFPPINGKPQEGSLIASRLRLVLLLASALRLVFWAYDSMKLFDRFNPTQNGVRT